MNICKKNLIKAENIEKCICKKNVKAIWNKYKVESWTCGIKTWTCG